MIIIFGFLCSYVLTLSLLSGHEHTAIFFESFTVLAFRFMSLNLKAKTINAGIEANLFHMEICIICWKEFPFFTELRCTFVEN